MKQLLPKPISSPSRTDNFPPPLLRFLRSNGGSRSRGRSRSSPIFIRKKNETAAAANETQEPSSPKVTCMGQVRVRRSKQKQVGKSGKNKSRCWWIRKALFFNRFTEKSKNPRGSKPFWRRWFLYFQMGFRRKAEIVEESAKQEETEEEEEIEDDRGIREAKMAFVSNTTPPKNALLLMRCRSEPYRASSLASRFWGSEEETEETEQEKKQKKEEEEKNPISRNEPICRDSAMESRKPSETEEKLGFCDSSTSKETTSTKSEEEEEETETLKRTRKGEGIGVSSASSSSSRPLILTRCKSEPARRPERFDTEICFWKLETKVGFR